MEQHPVNLLGVVLAIVGGASSYLHKWLNGEPFVVAKFFATTFVGGFVGVLAYYLSLYWFPPESPLIIFVVGASGAIGYDAIKPLWEKVINRKL